MVDEVTPREVMTFVLALVLFIGLCLGVLWLFRPPPYGFRVYQDGEGMYGVEDYTMFSTVDCTSYSRVDKFEVACVRKQLVKEERERWELYKKRTPAQEKCP